MVPNNNEMARARYAGCGGPFKAIHALLKALLLENILMVKNRAQRQLFLQFLDCKCFQYETSKQQTAYFFVPKIYLVEIKRFYHD